MKNKFKIIIALAVVVAVVALPFAMYLTTAMPDIDTTSWTLTNNSFTVVPIIGETVSFYVRDMDGRTVFHWGDEGWRKWDFKSITLCEDNTIIITTGDMGEQELLYDGSGWTFK